MALSHLFNCLKRAVRRLPGPGGLRNGFSQVSKGFQGFWGSLASPWPLDLPGPPWSPPDLETNKKLGWATLIAPRGEGGYLGTIRVAQPSKI